MLTFFYVDLISLSIRSIILYNYFYFFMRGMKGAVFFMTIIIFQSDFFLFFLIFYFKYILFFLHSSICSLQNLIIFSLGFGSSSKNSDKSSSNFWMVVSPLSISCTYVSANLMRKSDFLKKLY